MHVISKKAWKDAVAADPALEGPISEWYKVASSASWQNLMEHQGQQLSPGGEDRVPLAADLR